VISPNSPDRPRRDAVGPRHAAEPWRRGRAGAERSARPGQALSRRCTRTRLCDRALAWRVPAAHAAALARPRRTAAAALRLPGRPSGDSTLVRVPAVRARHFSERSLLMNDTLTKALKQLRLSGLLQSLEVRLQEAAS